MKQVPDRKKLRREYLRKKWRANAKATIGALLGTSLVFAVLIIGYFTLGWLVIYIVYPADIDTHVYLRIIRMGAVMFVVSILLIWPSVKVYRKGIAESTNIPNVPPVTPNTLPADEILVRGSVEPPVQQSEVLLRAATGQETPKEELLRVSN